jgi:hypothetical protein
MISGNRTTWMIAETSAHRNVLEHRGACRDVIVK